jgi:cell division protease FtsH
VPSNQSRSSPLRPPLPERERFWRGVRTLLWNLPILVFLLWIGQDILSPVKLHTIAYSEFKQHLSKRDIIECSIGDSEIRGRIRGIYASETAPSDATRDSEPKISGEAKKSLQTKEIPDSLPARESTDSSEYQFRTVRIEDPKLVEELQAAGVKVYGVQPGHMTSLIVAWLLPIGLALMFWWLLVRGMGAAAGAALSIGKSRARLVSEKSTGVTFDDVAGCDEAKYELQEVVDFLKHPQLYTALGAKIPKGVLLLGPPGTGKTLIAKAVAGEAETPFFSLSGSDFVEMFVGVGASRVRDLFEQAKAQAPCIVFVDELDAIGRERGIRMSMANDEREQTLNQLLVEMDGFDPNAGVILLAATNRPEILDRALLRPGRFDRQVILDAPDANGREAILKVHARNKPLADDVDLRKVALATPGFSGADLANALNEAALLAARHNARKITQQHIEDAVEKVVAGPERRSRRLNDEERRRVAYHEAGHALVGAFSKHADPIHKISIVPRGRAALGYTMQLPTEQQMLMTRSALLDRLNGLLGGRAAEEIVYHEVSTGAENDLERATLIARQMVCIFGMNDEVGLMHCARRESMFLTAPDTALQADCSDHTAEIIDEQVRGLLDTAFNDAKAILSEHRGQLEIVARELLKRESLDATTFQELLKPDPVLEPAA